MTDSSPEYKAHMTELLRKLDPIFQGETATDSAYVMAVGCTWAVYCGQPSKELRWATLKSITAIMHDHMKQFEAGEGTGTLFEQ